MDNFISHPNFKALLEGLGARALNDVDITTLAHTYEQDLQGEHDTIERKIVEEQEIYTITNKKTGTYITLRPATTSGATNIDDFVIDFELSVELDKKSRKYNAIKLVKQVQSLPLVELPCTFRMEYIDFKYKVLIDKDNNRAYLYL